MGWNFVAKAHQYRDAFDIRQKDFEAIVKQSLSAAAELWVKEYLPKHFEPEAMQRYGLRRRSRNWNRQKNRGWIRSDSFFAKQNAKLGISPPNFYVQITPQPPGQEQPLVARGDLKRHVLSNAMANLANAKFSGIKGAGVGAAPITISVKLPFPHPLNPLYKGELVKMTSWERKHVQGRFHATMRRLLKEKHRMKQGFKWGGYSPKMQIAF